MSKIDMNELDSKTVIVLDLKLNAKNHMSSGFKRDGYDYITDMIFRKRNEELICTIPYQAEQLLEQAVYLIHLANHCIKENKNIQY